VPRSWFDAAHGPLRERCGVPAGLPFQTEPTLALEMLRGLVARREVPFRWVVADEHFGSNPAFLEAVAALGKWYLVEVSPSTKVWLEEPKIKPAGPAGMGRPRKHPRLAEGEPPAQEIHQVAAGLPQQAWRRYTIQEGSQGPIRAEFVFLRVTRARRRRPLARLWLVLRRGTDPNAEVKAYLSNAPQSCARTELVRVSGRRWPIESALEEAKGELGMDHYETRSWRGWHHHMTQTFLAHHFLVRMRLKLKKSPGPDSGPSSAISRQPAALPALEPGRGPRNRALSSAAELRGLSITPETNIETISSQINHFENMQSLVVVLGGYQ
jgi:SRSO17 transposase